MIGAKNERQLGDERSFRDLKEAYRTRPAAAVNDIGMLAVGGGCSESLDFLMKVAIGHQESEVRRTVIDYLGDLQPKHPQIKKVRKAVQNMIARENVDRIRVFAETRLSRLLRKTVKRSQYPRAVT